MICPNCKKELADNANTCPECGYDFEEINKKDIGYILQNPEKVNVKPKQILIGVIVVFIISIILAFIIPTENNYTSTPQNETPTYTQEQIQIASDFITTMEAAELIKEVKDTCSDGSKGCYYFMIDENVWEHQTTYEVKKNVLNASEIYASTKQPYKFFEGKGYMTGKKLYDIWGIKQ